MKTIDVEAVEVAKHPTELALAITPPTMELANYDALVEWASKVEENYAGLVVLEEHIPATKADMAELRRIAKQLDASRIAAVKQVSGPIKDFEAKIKSVAERFLGIADSLGAQVKNYEERAREEKRQQVLFAIETLTAEAGYPGLAIPVQDSWLNKTQKPKATADAIKAIIADHIKAENDAAALEQAKQDRAVAIEQQCAALAQGYGFALPVSQFLKLHDLRLALVDVHESITAAYRAKADQMARENVAPVVAPAPQAAPMQTAPAPSGHMMAMQDGSTAQDRPVERVGQTIHLEYDRRRGVEVNEAMRALERLCLNFVNHGKPLAQYPGQTQTAPRAPRAPRPY